MKKSKQSDEFQETIARGLTNAFHSPAKVGGLFVSLAIVYLVLKNAEKVAVSIGLQGTMKILVLGIVFLPVVLLLVWGSDETGSVGPFEEISFKNKAGQYPKLIAKYKHPKDRRIQVYEYKTPGIPLQTWMDNKDAIETAMNLSIIQMYEDTDDKRIIVMETIPPTYRLPVSTIAKPFMWDEKYNTEKESECVIGMGQLDPITVDLNKFPHMLMAGTTGSGKSVIVQCVLWQLVKKGAIPIIIDFKGGIEFGGDWPSVGGRVVTELDDALDIIKRLAAEQEVRFRLLRQDGEKFGYDCKNMKAYNKVRLNGELEKMCEKKNKWLREHGKPEITITEEEKHPLARIIFVVDEAGDLLSQEGKSKEEKAKIQELTGDLASLAMKSRAVGINMILGIQRPDAKTLGGQIRNNIPIKVCGRCMGGDAVYLSEMVLGTPIATTINANIEGRFYGNFGAGIVQFQSYYFEPHKFLKPGNWRKGKTIVLEKEGPKDDPEYYEPLKKPSESKNEPQEKEEKPKEEKPKKKSKTKEKPKEVPESFGDIDWQLFGKQ